MNTFKADIKNRFNLNDDQLSSHCTDLHIMPLSLEQRNNICEYLKSIKMYYETVLSDVKGQDWYGQAFIEIPFALM